MLVMERTDSASSRVLTPIEISAVMATLQEF